MFLFSFGNYFSIINALFRLCHTVQRWQTGAVGCPVSKRNAVLKSKAGGGVRDMILHVQAYCSRAKCVWAVCHCHT